MKVFIYEAKLNGNSKIVKGISIVDDEKLTTQEGFELYDVIKCHLADSYDTIAGNITLEEHTLSKDYYITDIELETKQNLIDFICNVELVSGTKISQVVRAKDSHEAEIRMRTVLLEYANPFVKRKEDIKSIEVVRK